MTTILIVDDDVYIGDMLEEILTKEGYRAARAYSGTEALQAVKKVAGAADMDTEAVLKAALKYLF